MGKNIKIKSRVKCDAVVLAHPTKNEDKLPFFIRMGVCVCVRFGCFCENVCLSVLSSMFAQETKEEVAKTNSSGNMEGMRSVPLRWVFLVSRVLEEQFRIIEIMI